MRPTPPSGRWTRAGSARRWRRRSGPGPSPGGRCCPASTAPGSRTAAPRSTWCTSGPWSCWSTSTWPRGAPPWPSDRPATWSPSSRSGTPPTGGCCAPIPPAATAGRRCAPTTGTGGCWPRSWGSAPPPSWRRPTWSCSTPSRPAWRRAARAAVLGGPRRPAAGRRRLRRPGAGAAPAARRLDRRAAGQRRTVLVAGEAGIGKTRLVTELATLAEQDGAVVLAGRCDQHLGVPYLPLREAVGRQLAAYPSERLRTLLGPRAAELVRFWPELAWRLPALPAQPAVGSEADPYLLFDALTGLLEAMAVTGPLLLLVDDLHGADEATLLLLRSLAQRLAAGAAADRPDLPGRRAGPPDQPDRRPRRPGPLARGRAADPQGTGRRRGRRDGRGHGGPAARPGRPGPGPCAPRADRRQPVPGGRAAAAPGRDGRPRGGGDVAEAAAGPAADDVPESVRWVVGQRMARLGGPVEHVLGVAAVIGQQADVAVLGRVADLGYDSLLSALDTAVAAGLLEVRPGAPGRYAFHHPIVRDLLYRKLAAGERARIHRRVGEALEELTGGTGRLGELADHFALAGTPFTDRAVELRPPGRRGGVRHGAGTRRRPTGGGRPWPCSTAPAPPSTRSAAASCCSGRATPGPRPARPAWPPRPTCGRRRPPGRPARPAAWPGPRSGWAARPGSGRSSSTGGPTGLLGEAIEAAGPGDSKARALLLARLAAWRTAGARLGAGDGPRRPGSARRWRWPAASATARPWRRSWPTRRSPGTASSGRTGRPPPWPPPPSWTAWRPSWATRAWPTRRAARGRGRCWPPATWTGSTG